MKNPSNLTDPNVYSNYAYDKKEPVVLVNNDKKKKVNKTTVKELKNAIPKKLRTSKYEQTGDQQLRVYKNYIQPQLLNNDTNDPNNDLVQSLKDVFGKDNKEKLNQPLPSFTYENETVRQKLSNDLFAVENENKRIDAATTIQRALKEPLQKRKQRNELLNLVLNTPYKKLDENQTATPYKYTDEKQNLISNSLEGIVSTAKKDKNDKENKSAKIITRAMTIAKNRKDNKMIQEGLKIAKDLNNYDNTSGLYVSSIKRGNKVVGLDYADSTKKAERMQPRNLLQNFEEVKPKPKKVYRESKLKGITKDASTQPRGAGRPKLSSYKKATAENFKSANQRDEIF